MKLFGFEHHNNPTPWDGAPHWALELRVIMGLVLISQEAIMAELDDITAQVAANKVVIDSAVVLINGIADRITAAGVDPAKLAALTASLKSEDDALAAAVTANTPAAKA